MSLLLKFENRLLVVGEEDPMPWRCPVCFIYFHGPVIPEEKFRCSSCHANVESSEYQKIKYVEAGRARILVPVE